MNRRRFLLGSLGAALAAGMTLPAHEAILLSEVEVFVVGGAAWNRMLSETERDAIASGFSPLHFPDGLIYRAPRIPRGLAQDHSEK